MRMLIEAFTNAFAQLSDKAVLRVLIKSMLITLLVFVVKGVGLYFGLIWMGTSFKVDTGSGFAEAAAAVIITGLAFWFLFRVVAVAVLHFFADEVVAAVEAKHFPELVDQAKPLPFRRDLRNSMKGMGRTIGVHILALPVAGILLITGVGPALLFLIINAWLLGRELTEMAWLRHCEGEEDGNPVPQHHRMVLGGIVAGIMVIPFANLLAPVVGAAAGTHLSHRAMLAKRAKAGRASDKGSAA